METIGRVLDDLQSGFSDADHKAAIEDLLSFWSDSIGPQVSYETRQPQVVSFDSNIALKLRGFGETPVLVLGEDSPECRKAVASLVKRTGSGRILGVILCMTASAFRYLRCSTICPPGRFFNWLKKAAMAASSIPGIVICAPNR